MNTSEQSTKGITTVSSLIPLVHRLAGKFRRDNWGAQDREDIQQEGFVGLIEAAGRFEPERGCSLSTYGGKRAVGAMMDYVRCLCRKSREKATDETPQDVLQYRMDRAEMNLPGSMESGVMLLRFRKFLGSDLNGIGFLDDDEREVIRLRFFEGKSCREAAVVMNVSAATVCRTERRALTRLRKNFVQKFCGPAAASGHQADIRAVSCESVDFDDDGDCESTGLHAILASLTL